MKSPLSIMSEEIRATDLQQRKDPAIAVECLNSGPANSYLSFNHLDKTDIKYI